MAQVFFQTITGPKITDGSGDEMWLTADVWCDALDADGLFPNNTGTTTSQVNYWVKFNNAATDTANTFVATGNWPVPSGAVSIGSPTKTTSQNIASKISNVTPKFGETLTQSVNCQLSGVEKVPGTAVISSYVYLPRKRWLAPLAPATVTLAATSATVATATLAGNQRTITADRYWSTVDTHVQTDAEAWVENNTGLTGETTTWTIATVANKRYQVGANAWNADGGRSGITYSGLLYTKPAAPSALAASRQATKTTVLLTWTNNAPWASTFVVERQQTAGGAWVQIGTSATNSYTDTGVALDATPSYRVTARTPAPAVDSDVSGTVAVGAGYSLPEAPVLALERIDDTSMRVLVSGNQSNPALDKFWSRIYWSVQTDTSAYIGSSYVSGDTVQFTIPGLSADHRYKVMARSWNANGYSEFSTSGYLYTTPAAPSAVVAARVGVSSTVNVTWTNNARWPGSYVIERSLNSGAFAPYGTDSDTSYTDVGMPTTSFGYYRVQAVTPAPAVSSGYSATSNTVTSSEADKQGIPGVDKIFLGTTEVYRVLAGTKQLWLG